MSGTEPWAKLTRHDDGSLAARLPLLDHCLDVGAALDAILPVWQPSLEEAAGRPLTSQDIARLIVLAALHDIGKANRGFQARIDPAVKQTVGHTGPVAALLRHSGLRQGPAAKALFELLMGWGADQHLVAVMAHHGRPLAEFHTDAGKHSDSWTRHVTHWMPQGHDDPAIAVVHLIDALRERWPTGWGRIRSVFPSRGLMVRIVTPGAGSRRARRRSRAVSRRLARRLPGSRRCSATPHTPSRPRPPPPIWGRWR
ncbi:MAG TPA: CRISPR-associated endonuclease Cas3'' [Candidatus Sphingomonas excrementigallinarum]|nr:CRISPR-associated endonuclease Cas3'' [Candidatus Sphingomonas excrementigallinarum]